MKHQYIRLFFPLVACGAILCTPILQADQLSLPSADLIAPEVFYEPITKPITAGSSARISAKVTDNVGVSSVVLFYRTKGTEQYKRVAMSQIGETDQYEIVLDQGIVVSPGLEYYIQASDYAGNTLLHGYAFAPLSLSVAPAVIPKTLAATAAPVTLASDEKNATETSKASNKKTWMWIAGGVLAAGVIASLSRSSDDGGNTGTVVINAPGP